MGDRYVAPIWHTRAEEIRKLAADGMFDHEIGKLYGVTAATIYNVRWHHNIPGNVVKRKPKKKKLPKDELQTIERDGQTITICPPRYAANVYMTNWVRPTGRR